MLFSLFFSLLFNYIACFCTECVVYVVEMYIKQSFCDARNTASFFRTDDFNVILSHCFISSAAKTLCLPRPHFDHSSGKTIH